MLQARQYLALAAETAQDEIGIEPGPHHLDGDLGFVLAVSSLREVNGAHAAAPQFTRQSIRSDLTPDHPARLRLSALVLVEFEHRLLDARSNEVLRGIRAGEQRVDFVAQFG